MIKIVSVLRSFCNMPTSRKMQYLSFLLSRCKTVLIYKIRLLSCGTGSIVRKPLFWTPEFISIGNNVLILDGCRIEGVNTYGFVKYSPNIVFGDNVSMQQRCHITAAGKLIIGSGTTILSGVVITDIDHCYNDLEIPVLDQSIKVEETCIGKNCFIGAGACIFSGTRLGDNCVVGANSVVRGVFPSGSVIVGAPAKIVKRYNKFVGLWQKVDYQGEYIHE